MIYDRVWSTPLFPPRPRRGMMRWKFSNFRKWSPKWDKAETPARRCHWERKGEETRKTALKQKRRWGFHIFLFNFLVYFSPDTLTFIPQLGVTHGLGGRWPVTDTMMRILGMFTFWNMCFTSLWRVAIVNFLMSKMWFYNTLNKNHQYFRYTLQSFCKINVTKNKSICIKYLH